MAIGDMTNCKTKLTLRQELATDSYGNQTLNYWNPTCTDEQFYRYATQLGALTDKTVDQVIRTDNYDIATA